MNTATKSVAILNSSAGFDVAEMAVTRDEREVLAGRSLDESVKLFVGGLYTIVKTHYNNPDRAAANRWGVRITTTDGPRYVKIFVATMIGREDNEMTAEDGRGYIYAFVDKLTGDVLKPASTKGPAKHARGNVFNANPCEWCGPYGITHVR